MRSDTFQPEPVPFEVPYKPLFDCAKAHGDLAWQPHFTVFDAVRTQMASLHEAGLLS